MAEVFKASAGESAEPQSMVLGILVFSKDGGGYNQSLFPARGVGQSNRRSRYVKMPVTRAAVHDELPPAWGV